MEFFFIHQEKKKMGKKITKIIFGVCWCGIMNVHNKMMPKAN
jgi:hypothetical protein